MRPCEDYLDLISAQLDGALSPQQAQELSDHLAQCPSCRALAQDLAALQQATRCLAATPPAALIDTVRARIQAQPTVVPFSPPAKQRHQWRGLAALAAVFAVVLLGAGSLRLAGFLGSVAQRAPMSAAEQAPASDGARALPEPGEGAPGAAPAPTPRPSPSAPPPQIVAHAQPYASDARGEMAPATPPPASADAPRTKAEAPGTQAEAPGTKTETSGANAETFGTQAETPGTTANNAAASNGEAAPTRPILCQSPPTAAQPADATALTPQKACETLFAAQFSQATTGETARLLDTEDFLGYQLTRPAPSGADLQATLLEYVGLTPNQRYYQFHLYTLTYPRDRPGDGQQTTLNYFAVQLDGSALLMERTAEGDATGDAYRQATGQ